MASLKIPSDRIRLPARPGASRRRAPGKPNPIPVEPAQIAAAVQRAFRPQAPLSAGDVHVLQRAGGNQAVQRLLDYRGQARWPAVQAKLTVGAAGDAYEREADRIAAQIAGPARSTARSASSASGAAIRRRAAQGGPIGAEGGAVPADLERRVAVSDGGRPMPAKVRGVLENRLGADLSPVRIHTDANAVQLNQQFGAQAFTHRNHIFYGPGQSPDDLALTAHETVHTIQQGAVGPGRVSRQAAEQPLPVEAEAPEAVQRKFGLEVELGIFMNSGAGVKNEATGAMKYDPPKVKNYPVVAQDPAHSLELHMETGSSGTPKVELVSNPPYDEFAESEETVKAKLKAMRDFARNAETETAGFTKRVGVHRVMPQAKPVNFLGSESPSASSVQNVKGDLQATYGVRLDRVKALFDLQSQPAQEKAAETAPTTTTPDTTGLGVPPPPPPGPPPPMMAKKEKADDSAKNLKDAMAQTERLVAALQLEALGPGGHDVVTDWVARTNRTTWLGKDKKRSIGLQNLDGLVAQLGIVRGTLDRATLGHTLNSVRTALSNWRGSKATWYGAARESMREAEAHELELEANRLSDLLNDLLTDQSTAELEGFLALICNYLLAGKSGKGIGWGKNKVGQLFYKSRLSSVRANLTGAIDDTIRNRQPRVEELILAETSRGATDGVLTGQEPLIGNWLGAILGGTGDPMFDSLKNEYADEIKPKDEWDVGDGSTITGVVAENRQLSQLIKGGQMPEDWVTTGVKLHRMLRMVNGLDAPVINDIRAVLNDSSPV